MMECIQESKSLAAHLLFCNRRKVSINYMLLVVSSWKKRRIVVVIGKEIAFLGTRQSDAMISWAQVEVKMIEAAWK
jgi:hypothetical protein